jgi:hypothetical protein
MRNAITIKTKNALIESKKALSKVPMRYRVELCELLEEKFANPHTFVFRHSNYKVVIAFHTIFELYDKLCDEDKDQFRIAFTSLSENLDIL